MSPLCTDGPVTLYQGDCLAVLPLLSSGSIDAVVTDPPYGLGLMGRERDTFGPSGARARYPSDRDREPGAAHNATTSLVARTVPEAYVAGQPFQAWCRAWAAECLRVLRPGGHLVAFGGLVLDPFAGTGTTLQAARDEGFRSVGIEAHEPYCRLAVQRLPAPG